MSDEAFDRVYNDEDRNNKMKWKTTCILLEDEERWSYRHFFSKKRVRYALGVLALLTVVIGKFAIVDPQEAAYRAKREAEDARAEQEKLTRADRAEMFFEKNLLKEGYTPDAARRLAKHAADKMR